MNFSCPICTDLVEDAAVIRECEHIYCRPCLDGWIESQKIESIPCPVLMPRTIPCPECRKLFSKEKDIGGASRFMRNMLSEIRLKCPFEDCEMVVGYDSYKMHQLGCKFNPEKKVLCIGCDTEFSLPAIDAHKEGCIQYVRYEMSLLCTELTRIKTDRPNFTNVVKSYLSRGPYFSFRLMILQCPHGLSRVLSER